MPPSLVLLHGFTHTGASWAGVVAALDERYRAFTPDIRGHGSAWDRSPVTLEAVTQDIDRLSPEPFTLAGYSMGGRIALHVALALSGRVERLILISASPGIADPAQRHDRRLADERLADALEGSPIEAFAERWGQLSLFAGQAPTVREAAHADRLRNHPVGLARALRGLGTANLPPVWDRLHKLRQPVALIVGERDLKFRDLAYAMVREVRHAQLHVVPGVGHAVHLEAPDTVAELIAHPPS